MKFIISLLILSAMSADAPTETPINSTPPNEIVSPIEEEVFIRMERTPCFGQCPSYKITIFNTGRVLYEGYSFVDQEGNFETSLSKAELARLKKKIDEIKIFALKNKYDTNITDIPSCLIYVNDGEQTKKIYDRYGAPEDLKDFEKLIDKLVLIKDLKKLNKSE